MAEGFATSVVGKVVDSLFGVAKKEIGYMWNCSKNIENFKKVLQDLKDTKERVQQQINLANSKGDNLLVGVERWVETVNEEIFTAETFLEEEANAKKTCCKLRLCGNWVTLHRYGKKVTQMTTCLTQHQKGGKPFESCVSFETHAPGPLDVYQNKNLNDIDTHKLVLEKVIAAIEDENIQIIGIYGLGGVGKTTIAKEVTLKMKNHFAHVAFTTISQSLEVEKVKKDIEETTKRIMKGEKVLIILDDVWEKLNLEDICIPCGSKHMNCKILLTSRSEDVCTKMNAQRKMCVRPLKKDETWILFKQVVGERIESDVTLKLVAMVVAEECGGLPLLIQAVGSALKVKSIDLWKSFLNRLKEHEPLDIDPDIKKAYIHLKLSYDYLESEEARTCFLLCSMWPEDHTILLEDLVYYGVGLAKFNKLKSMNDARDRVQNAVNILTSSGLLLNMNDDENEYIKMHDVVRDVALLIGSEGNNKFLVEAGKGLLEWMPRKESLESYTRISLMSNEICELPNYEVNLPHLTTLLIHINKLSKVSNEFFRGMQELRVLDMSWNKISSLPQSLKLLTKICMLDLRENESLDEISIIGELKDLEILILSKTGIKEIPKAIGQLVNLRVFDVSKCRHLCHISSGVLLKLCWLEDLRIGFYRMHDDVIHDSLVEVMKLSKLTYLDLVVPCSDVIPKGFNWGKSNGFVIEIGGYIDGNFFSVSERRLVVSYNPIHHNTSLNTIENMNNILGDLYQKGINDINGIYLKNIPNVRWFVEWDELQTFVLSKEHQFGDKEGETEDLFFTNLKHLELSWLYCLEVIWKCPDEYITRQFSNLVTLYIVGCKKLIRLFSVSVAQGLVSLQKLRIVRCHVLKEVLWGGDHGETQMAENIIVFPSLASISLLRLESLKSFWGGLDEETDDKVDESEIVEHSSNIIEFPTLAKISLYYLKSLRSFYSGNFTTKYPSLVEVEIENCKKMKKWGNGIQETPKLKFIADVALHGPYAINDALVKHGLEERQKSWKT